MSSTEMTVESKNKLLSAIRAAAYLNKHSHALEDSILRRTIVLAPCEVPEDPSAKQVAYCSSCNARSVDKCLQLLIRLSSSELQVVVKKTAKVLTDHGPKVAVVAPLAKPGFKPSLDCKRRPLNYTNFSYAMMKKVVKDDMSQKQDQSEKTLREVAFFNPDGSSNVGPIQPRSDKSENGDRRSCNIIAGTTGHKSRDNVPTTKLPENSATISNVLVPLVKLDSNGQIVLDPLSLVAPLPGIAQDRGLKGSAMKNVKWSFKDTVNFYEALHQHGTDFSMMMTNFPNRERKNIKKKFLFEDKNNRSLVDTVMGSNCSSSDLQDVIQQLKVQKDMKLLTRKKFL